MIQYVGEPKYRSSNENLNTILDLITQNPVDIDLDFKNLSQEQKEMASQMIGFSNRMKSCTTWADVVETFTKLYVGSFAHLEKEMGRNILGRATMTATDCDDIITSTREKIFSMEFSGTDVELKANLLSNKELADELRLNYIRENPNESSNFEKYVQEVVYAHRIYKLYMHQHYYPKERLAKLEVKNGFMVLTYHDISKFDLEAETKAIASNHFDETDKNMGGMRALLDTYPSILDDCSLSYKRLDNEMSQVSVFIKVLPKVQEEHTVVLSALGLVPIVQILDSLVIRYPSIRVNKYLCEEVITNILYHNFSVPLKTQINIFKGGVVGFELLK